MRGTNNKTYSMCAAVVISERKVRERESKNEHHFLLLFAFNGNIATMRMVKKL